MYIIFFFKKYYYGESIVVNVLVDNNIIKFVRKIKILGMCNIYYNYVRKLNFVYLVMFLKINRGF